jgi:hypothetical protein
MQALGKPMVISQNQNPSNIKNDLGDYSTRKRFREQNPYRKVVVNALRTRVYLGWSWA